MRLVIHENSGGYSAVVAIKKNPDGDSGGPVVGGIVREGDRYSLRITDTNLSGLDGIEADSIKGVQQEMDARVADRKVTYTF